MKRPLPFTVFAGLSFAIACGSSSPDVTSDPNGASGADASAGNAGSSHSSGAGSGGSTTLVIDSSSAGASGANNADVCGSTKLAASPKQVNVLLVVDKSSSMSATPSGFGDSKWNGIRAALGTALDATKGKVAFGLDFFPSSGSASVALSDVCELPKAGAPTVGVAAGAAANAAIKAALADNAPAGATPTAAALNRALDYFTKGAGAALVGEHYVLLATDGGPNCDAALSCPAAACTVNMDGLCPGKINCCDPKLDPSGPSKCLDDGATLAVVKALAKANVKTFVVGIPGTEAYGPTLDAVSLAGGEPNPGAPPSYFAIAASGGVKALGEVLTNITTGLIHSCDLVLSEDPPDYDKINVVIDGKTIAEGAVDGWILDTANQPPTVRLKGSTCRAVETAGAQSLNITFGCPTEHVK